MFLLGCDPSPDVRRAVLSAIAATTKTLGSILERTKDVKELVRKLAYQMIAEKIDIRALTIAQRVSLLREGLNDRSGELCLISCCLFTNSLVWLVVVTLVFVQIVFNVLCCVSVRITFSRNYFTFGQLVFVNWKFLIA